MQPLGVVGPGADDLLNRLAARLDGRVATVERDAGPDRTDGPDAAYRLAPDGSWSGEGTGRSLADLLDDLAPVYDYALLAGFARARVPTVVLGDADADGETVLAAPEADAVDLDGLLARLEELEPHVTLTELVDRATASPLAERSGAVATFTGRVRQKDSPDDPRTERLEFEKYEGVADERIETISDELTDRDGVFEVLMHHRTGVVEAGEDIVFVVVLAGHREEAFRTVRDGINRLKEQVPIFKKETTTDEEFWIHEQ